MHCELCGSVVDDILASTVNLATAARRMPFVDLLIEDYQDRFGVPIGRTHLQPVLDKAGGHMLVCPNCRESCGVPDSAASISSWAASPGAEDVGDGPAPATVEECLAALEERDGAAARQAARALAERGAEAVQPLLQWLREHKGDRSMGVRALGQLRVPEAAELLLNIALAGEAGEPIEARRALALLGEAALPAFGAALAPGSALGMEGRRAVLGILAFLGPDTVPLICSQLSHEQVMVRQSALAALASWPLPGTIGALAALVEDPVRDVRKAVALLLARTGDPRAAPLLIRLTVDPHPEVRVVAAWCLTRLGQALPREAVLAAADQRVDKWLVAALLQLAGLARAEAEAVLTERGTPVRLEPWAEGDAQARAEEGRRLLGEGAFGAAAESLYAATWESPLERSLLALLAEAQSRGQQWEAAGATLERLILFDPFSARWHHNLGIAEFRLGRQTTAADQFRAAVALDPNHAAAQEALQRAGTGPDGALHLCVGHPRREASAACAQCGLPLCRDCAYQSPLGVYCERHVPPTPETRCTEAQRLVALARREAAALPSDIPEGWQPAGAGTKVAMGVTAVALMSPLLAIQAARLATMSPGDQLRPAIQRRLGKAMQLLGDALAQDPGSEAAALLMQDLGAVADSLDNTQLLPREDRARALLTCAGCSPEACAAWFYLHCRADCGTAVEEYFARLVRRKPTPWDEGTPSVIDEAARQGFGPRLLQYLAALRPRLAGHPDQRRQCRAQIHALRRDSGRLAPRGRRVLC
jgi:HEAT repeat protein